MSPEVIAILINDEKFGRDTEGDQPFPFRHDWLGGADHAGNGVLAGAQKPNEFFAALRRSVVGDTEDDGIRMKAGGESRIAGDEVDRDIAAHVGAQMRQQVFESEREPLSMSRTRVSGGSRLVQM